MGQSLCKTNPDSGWYSRIIVACRRSKSLKEHLERRYCGHAQGNRGGPSVTFRTGDCRVADFAVRRAVVIAIVASRSKEFTYYSYR